METMQCEKGKQPKAEPQGTTKFESWKENQNMINWTKKEESESRGIERGHREVFKED